MVPSIVALSFHVVCIVVIRTGSWKRHSCRADVATRLLPRTSDGRLSRLRLRHIRHSFDNRQTSPQPNHPSPTPSPSRSGRVGASATLQHMTGVGASGRGECEGACEGCWVGAPGSRRELALQVLHRGGGGGLRRAVAAACATRTAAAQWSGAERGGVARGDIALRSGVRPSAIRCVRTSTARRAACAPRKRRLADRQRGPEPAPPRLPPRPTQHPPVNTGGKWQTSVPDAKQTVTHRTRFGTQCNLRSRIRPEAVHHVKTEPAYFTSGNLLSDGT